jgi:hypothetical protein
MSTRSRSIAAQALSCALACKWGEVPGMKQIGMLDGLMTMTAKNTYGSIFVDQLNSLHVEAMRQIFPDSQGERARRRASKSDRRC